MSIRKLCFTWEQLFGSCGMLDKICQQMKAANYKPDVIVGIARGGLVVAVALAHRLGIRKVYSVGMCSYDGEHHLSELDCYQELPRALSPSGKILVVDDIADSGKTLQFLVSGLQWDGYFNIKVATLFWKPKSCLKPDFCLPVAQDTWVIFPFERGIPA